MKKALAPLVSAAAAVSLITLAPAPAHASEWIEVHTEKVCVVARADGQVTAKYVLTRQVAVYVDGHGHPTGETATTRWKRWNKGEYPRKWERFCAPQTRD